MHAARQFHHCGGLPRTPPRSCRCRPAKQPHRRVARPLASLQGVPVTTPLSQTADSWGLQSCAPASPVVLLVDGTNLGSISAGSPASRQRSSSSSSALRQTTQERFLAWLQFLAAVASSAAAARAPLAAVLVAFDNKGSALTNVRAQLQPNYLSMRYTGIGQQKTPSAAARASVALSGWGELAAVVEQLNQQHQQQQQPATTGQQQPAAAAAAMAAVPGWQQFLVAHAAYGFEADDVMAAAAHWCRTQLDPAPHIIIASSDSDMQQLLDGNTYWLQLLQVASAQHPSGLMLHSAAAFEREMGFAPAAYPDFLALTGKKEASVPGVGVSAKLSKRLLAKFGSLEAILAPGADLKPYGAAHKLLGEGQPGTDARRAAAAANLAVLRMRPQQQRLPQQQLQQCYSQALQQLRGQQPALQPSPPQPSQQQCGGLPPHHVQTQQVEAHESPQRNVGSHVSWLHPARRLHIQQCQPFLAVLQEALHSLGFTRQQANWTSPTTGLWCDLLAQPTSALAADGDSNSSSDASGVRLAFQILGPADLAAGAVLPLGGSYSSAVEALGQQLSDSCGCFSQGTSALGHPKRALLKVATGGAKRQLAQLKGLGVRVAVVPFHELQMQGCALEYVQAVLREHGGLV